jgi:hypothetical protein
MKTIIERLKKDEGFKGWLTPNYVKNFYNTDAEHIVKAFFELPFDMQYGIILKWPREVHGIFIEYQRNEETSRDYTYTFTLLNGDNDIQHGFPRIFLDFNTGLMDAISHALDTEGKG